MSIFQNLNDFLKNSCYWKIHQNNNYAIVIEYVNKKV
jgi:hypothetical protein